MQPDGRIHSGLMLATRTTLPRFSVSAAMCFPKFPDDPGSTVPPNVGHALSLRSARAALISLPGPDDTVTRLIGDNSNEGSVAGVTSRIAMGCDGRSYGTVQAGSSRPAPKAGLAKPRQTSRMARTASSERFEPPSVKVSD
jgi:hypothetical protein